MNQAVNGLPESLPDHPRGSHQSIGMVFYAKLCFSFCHMFLLSPLRPAMVCIKGAGEKRWAVIQSKEGNVTC